MSLKSFIDGPGPHYRLPGGMPQSGQTVVAGDDGIVRWEPTGGYYDVSLVTATATGGATGPLPDPINVYSKREPVALQSGNLVQPASRVEVYLSQSPEYTTIADNISIILNIDGLPQFIGVGDQGGDSLEPQKPT